MSSNARTTQPASQDAHSALTWLLSLRTIVWYGARKFARDRTPLLAAALAYRTVFSLIPMLVLALVAVRSFSSHEAMRSRLDSLFAWLGINELTITVPAGQNAGQEQVLQVGSLIDQFVEKAMARFTDINFTAITAVGVAILIYAALSLLIQIEQAFNAVYGATSGRRLMLRLTNYWTLLTLGSLGLFISFSVSDSLADMLSNLPGGLSWVSGLVSFLTTVGVTWIVLLFAYMRMPTTRVRLRPAAVGAAVAAALWEVAKQGLQLFVVHATSGHVSIYGSLALIPIFLLWVQITWTVILVGLQISYAVQNFSNAALLKAEDRRRKRDPLIDPAIGIILMRDVSRAFKDGKPRPIEALADMAGITEILALPILERLAETGFLNRVERGADDEAFSLARPAEQIKVSEVLMALRELVPSPRDEEELRLLDRLLDKQVRATEGLSIADLEDNQIPRAVS